MDLHAENLRLAVPPIDTARLRLRATRVAEVDQIVPKINSLAISRWLTVVPYPYTRDDALRFTTECEAGRITAWSIWAGDDLVGNIGLAPTLGYWIAEDAWGKGYATEAAAALRDHHFASTDADDLQSLYFEGNEGSRRVLSKIGMRPCGTSLSDCKALGTKVPSVKMAMTRADWDRLRTPTE